MNFVPCVAWVPRGVAASNPEKLQLSPEELKCLVNETKELCGKEGINTDDMDEEFVEDDDDKRTDSNKTKTYADDEDDFDAIYNMDSYDDDDNDQNPVFTINSLAAHVDNNDDEYISDHESEAELEEKEDFNIKESDNLLVVGHVEDESSVLEIYVYNHDEDAFYVHHDIVLPSYPLALEWLDFHPAAEKPGNYVAIGDMSPVIQIWDLDVVDVLEPDYVLGKVSKKKTKKIKKELNVHSDAVISLSWNKLVRNLLASGSADSTIVLWDLKEAKGVNQLSFHTNKVQALQWHPSESPFLLSGDTDGYLKLYDCRSPDGESKSWTVNGEIERVAWNLQDFFKFFCSTDQGFIHMVDTRNSKIEHSFHAHKESVTGLDVSPLQPLTLISASMDRTLKLWDISDNFKMKKSYKLKVGSIYTTRAAPDLELTVAVGGNYSSNNLKIIDVHKEMTDCAPLEQQENPSLKFEVKQEKDFYSDDRGESSIQAPKCKTNQKFKSPKRKIKRERE